MAIQRIIDQQEEEDRHQEVGLVEDSVDLEEAVAPQLHQCQEEVDEVKDCV